MLRTDCLTRLANTYLNLSTRLLAAGLGVAVTGCSADISRFDAPMFGLTETGHRAASAPIPRESVLSYQATATSPAPASPVGSYSGSASRGSSEPDDRGYAGYGGPSAGPPQPTYNQPSYSQPSYRAPGRPQPAYQASNSQSYQQAPSVRWPQQHEDQQRPAPAYGPKPRSQEQTTVAALTPPASATDHAPPPFRSTSAASQLSSGNSRVVEVQPGDTLFSLAQRHRASISELMSLNGLKSPSIQPGQKIVLPEAPTAVAAALRRGPASEPQTTRVAALTEPAPAAQPKEQPSAAIANEPSSGSGPLFPEAAPPRADTAAESGETYTIRSGESLYGIAVRHRISLAELQRINDITDPRKVKAGTVLKLKSRSEAPALVAAAPERQPQSDSIAAVPEQAAPGQPAAAAGSATNPVIINAPSQRVAALDNSASMTDAARAPSVTQPDAAPAGEPPQQAKSAEEPKAEAAGKFRWPVRGKVIAGFGKQPDGSYSDGIKLSVPLGAEVHASESGVVAYAGNELKGYGNLVLLRHDNGWITAYAHNDELSVKRGDRVRRGQVIAKAGNTGSTDKPQLHFELRQGSSPVDPIPHLESL